MILNPVTEVSKTVWELSPYDGPAIASLPSVVLVDLLLLLDGALAEAHQQDLEDQQECPASHLMY